MSTVDPSLRPDCGACVGLCCVALPFGRSRDFAFDKAAGEACRHLTPADACGIHADLRERGMVGCTVFGCHGAGQQVSQVVYAGRSWRDGDVVVGEMFAVFAVVRGLHEMLVLLTDAARWAPTGHQELATLRDRLRAASNGTPAQVLDVDVDRLRAATGDLLRRLSAEVRGGGGASLAGADLVGRDLRGTDLRGADLRGALLLAARLDGSDLSRADLLGADLRDARLDGADLSGALLLTQPQLDAAAGDERTRLPDGLVRPGHWTSGPGAH
ncbi:pentapeptide repeat-containing protein [Nocardioides sp. dk4132]|uniref:pentapeptide repeat-containing protein n=1 Tax=unclassified Nocardioides TaxID=2615069 RepID=UPI001295AD2C|nr:MULTISPECIES: pentapeptide repeat-containing protein [unclassified Nocardioides]MQW75205.1 pentapeptide repeat-containing protein [Nocardioides sp. dk4132]QGA07641.1 pentapeptide repeat-containing protein [Nocardioides sp. dk884]